MLDGVMLLWFVLAACGVLFVAIDIRGTPESTVMKWAFVLVTAYTGVVGLFLYVLGCREPLPAAHERYVEAQWRQTLGSTMHCVAGDGVGILAAAVLGPALGLTGLPEIAFEYALGFAFGWTVFQALFMRDMAGGSYTRSLRNTFIPELLSMNLLMAGMVPTAMILRTLFGRGGDPRTAAFWFFMSIGLLVGAIVAYPINWWLVSYRLKHGMLTTRPSGPAKVAPAGEAHAGMAGMAGMTMAKDGAAPAPLDSAKAGAPMKMDMEVNPRPTVPVMTALTFVAFAVGLAIASIAS